MGFLGFLKKKKGDSIKDQLELPLPPKAGEDEAEMPSFPEEEPVEDLNLPEIPELEQQIPEDLEVPEFPNQQETEEPEAVPPAPEPEMPRLELPTPEELEQESSEDAYKYTPAMRDEKAFPEFPRKETRIPGFRVGQKGDVFIRGDEYRNLLEGLDTVIKKQREKSAKQERDILRLEERENERFMKIVEDLQRSMIVTENILFE